jgi:hypothetical protein
MPGLTATTFSKCAPSISTNIKQCGTVALCQAAPLTTGDLTDAYLKSGNYRVMEALLFFDMEIKECGITQLGMYEFLMANKVNMAKKVSFEGDPSLRRIAPFLKAKQFSPINNEFWQFIDGESAGGSNRSIIVLSPTNIPFDVRSFPVGLPVYLNSKSSAGSAMRTSWLVVSATDGGESGANPGVQGTLVLSPMNSNSNLDSDKLGNPVQGYLRRGSPNVDDYEKNCDEAPAYLNKKMVPFWIGTTRWSLCSSSKYDEYRALVRENNILFREFGDVDDIERNSQLSLDFQKRFINNFFFAKARDNQTLADYDQLDDITSFEGTDDLGVDGGICVGKRAEPVGVYEQLAECGRVVDLQGGLLNLPALFQSFQTMIRVRVTKGNMNRVIDVFTDSNTAELINQAMINYYNAKYNNTLRTTLDVGGEGVDHMNVLPNIQAKKAEFGFFYRSYPLSFPQGVTMNVLTHWSFDDELDVALLSGIPDTARLLAVLDFTGIYPGIIQSNRVIAETGDLKTLAKINPDFACVMKVHTRKQTLNSLTYTTVVECPAASLWIENFAGTLPNHLKDDNHPSYPAPGTTTTTTTT